MRMNTQKRKRLGHLKGKLANVGELARDAATLSNPASEPNKYSNSGLTEAALDALGSCGAVVEALNLESQPHRSVITCSRTVTHPQKFAAQLRDKCKHHP